ncbi:P2X purinoceptor 4-like isoform X2 [Lineus longissimus]|uniref:P2X purinoceptor 4-like isoform X2 n=1 Tax=Lineus longissimus TaxID=88925 RepID=UPI002B4F314B
MGCMNYMRSGIAFFFEYDTPRMVHINSKKIGVVNRIIQLAIIGYIIGWAIIYKKGYQEFDPVISSATAKLKGVVYTNVTDRPAIGARIWDMADYVVPPQENNAFFVTTNVIITKNQSQGECPEDPNIQDSWCESDADCPLLTAVDNGNGVRTGECVNSTLKPIRKVCKIYAWCPVENDTLPSPKSPLINPENFTVLIKNSIQFPLFKVKRRNILTTNQTYLQKCHFDPHTDKYCPIFVLGDMIRIADQDVVKMAVKGGVMGILIFWNCNLDHGVEECKPEYEFRRLDDENAAIAKGWNFRYANFYEENGVDKRTLVKAYGIRFIIMVKGTAGRFNFVPLALNIGSGLGLLAVATVLCDMFVLYCLKKRNYYREKKYLNVAGDDAYKLVESDKSNYGSVNNSNSGSHE